MTDELGAGVAEALITVRLVQAIARASARGLLEDREQLANADAADRVARHVGRLIVRAVDQLPEDERVAGGIELARRLIDVIDAYASGSDFASDVPIAPGEVLRGLFEPLPDGTPRLFERPLTPLLDTTVFTNAPGEPAVGHELRAEVDSAVAIDAVIAFIRWSGVRPLLDVLKRHCDEGNQVRVLTTTYTNTAPSSVL